MTDDVKKLIKRFDGPWHCFQCGDVCHTKDEAEAHFGYDPCKEPLCVTASKDPDGAMGVIRSLQALRSDLWSEGEMGVALYRFGMMQGDLKRYFGADTVHQAYNTANDVAFSKKVATGEFKKLEAELSRLSEASAAKDARIEELKAALKLSMTIDWDTKPDRYLSVVKEKERVESVIRQALSEGEK